MRWDDPQGGHRQQPHSSSGQSVVWTISFGDLLTLLVCFFLVLTPWQKLGKIKQSESPARGRSVAEFPAAVDSKFERTNSQSNVESPKVLAEIPIFAAHVNHPSLEGLSRLSSSISTELRSLAGTPTSMTIKICDDLVNVEDLVMMVGRFVEAEKPHGTRMLVGYPTTGCDEAGILRPVSERVVGAISVLGSW